MQIMPNKIFQALSDETRLKIVEKLGHSEVCACKFVGMTGKAQPTVSLHLRVLENAGIVKKRKDGKKVLYRLTDVRILGLIKSAAGLSHD